MYRKWKLPRFRVGKLGSAVCRNSRFTILTLLGVGIVSLNPNAAKAEGSFQLGLTQELVEWGPADTSRLIKIDVLNAGEVINVAAGGGRRNNIPNNSHQMRFTILDDLGAVIAVHETTGTGTDGKLHPTDPMNAPITNPWRFTPPSTGEYYLAVENIDDDLVFRLDVTVTPNSSVNPDPTGATGITGRVSSQQWRYLAGSFDEADATDADYFILTPGGAVNTNYVWKLDLNNFAGFGFSLRANSRGVDTPDSGFSIPFPDEANVPDAVQEEFDLYINYPEIALPEPSTPPSVQNFQFLDDEGVDNSISPDTSPTIQDTGVFSFTTDALDGTYEIAIDLNDNGQFGDAGDVRLLGNTVQGDNNVPWDGRDNTGNLLPYGDFDALISVRLGEFHFTAEDAETSGGNQDGLTVFRASPGGGQTPTNVFWDDVTRLPVTAGGTNNLPDGGLSGTAAGYHTWGNFAEGPLGDKQFIDTWVYGLSSTSTTGVTISDNDTPAPRLASLELTPLSEPGDTLTLTLNEPDLEGAGTVNVEILNVTSGEREAVTLSETAPDSGIFTGQITTEPGTGVSDNSGQLETAPGDRLEFRYTDTTAPGGGSQALIASDDVLGITLSKTGTLDEGGNGRADVGDVINYVFTVTNPSAIALSNIRVTDPLVTVVGANLPSLAAGASNNTQFTASYTITQSDIDAGRFINTATATGNAAGYGDVSGLSDDPTNPANVDPDRDGIPNDPTRTALSADASISLIKTGTLNDGGDGIANVGDIINYVFTVTNTGNVTLSAVALSDPAVTVSGGPIASLAPGASDGATFTARYAITQADIDAGEFENSASVAAQDPDGGAVTDTSDDGNGAAPGNDDPTITALPASADIRLLKAGTLNDGGDGQANVGDTISYAFTVHNVGNTTLTNVTVTDSKVTVMGGPLASLAAGASDSTSFTALYTLTQADLDAGQIVNTATVNSRDPGNNVVTDVSDDPNSAEAGDDDPTVTSLPVAAALTLLKTASFDDGGDGRADVGDIITYNFSLTNSGDATLSNVTITDPRVSVMGGPIVSFAPGASDTTTFTAQYSLTQTDIDAGEFENSAIASGQTPGGGTVSDTSDDPTNPSGAGNDPTVTTLAEAASVSLTKSGLLDDGGDGVADVGDVIDYTFTVTNTGNVTLNTLALTDAIATVMGGPIVSLAPGQVDSATFTARYALTQADITRGNVENQASITGSSPSGATVSDQSDDPGNAANDDDNADGEPDDPTVTLLGSAPAIRLTKTGTFDAGPDGVASVGDEITYVFSVFNAGNVPLDTIEITDPLVTVMGGPAGPLAPGDTDSTTFTARYLLTQIDIDHGRVENTATVQGRAPDGEIAEDTSDDPNNPADVDANGDGDADDPTVTQIPRIGRLELIKTGALDLGPDSIANVGDIINYAFSVSNTGPLTLQNVTITDPLVTISGAPLVRLAPGETDTTSFTAAYELTQSDIDRGFVENSATATGAESDGTDYSDISDDGNGIEAGNDDPTITPIPQQAVMALEKSASLNDGGDGIADVGDTIHYAFTVRNAGTVTLTDISISDARVSVSGGPIAALVPGAQDQLTFSAVYTLTAADIAAGQVDNMAFANAEDPSGDPVTAVSDDPANPSNVDPDGDGQPSDPTVTVLVVNMTPEAVNDMDRTPFDTPITLDPRVNDTDPEGDILTVTAVGPGTNGTAVINPDGTVTITPTPGFIGIINVPYTVCDDRGECDDAQIDITIEDPEASVEGTVYLDADLDEAFGPGEPGQPSWQVELLSPNGAVIAAMPTDANGEYIFAGIDIRAATGGLNSGQFRVRARHPETGITYRISDDVNLTGGTATQDVDLPVDPIGVIYDSVDRSALQDVIVTVQGPNGADLPAVCFRDPLQQSQRTGSDGQYYFDIVSGADGACPSAPTAYRVVITSPPNYVQGGSTVIPSERDAVDPPSGTGPFPVVPSAGTPASGAPTTYHYELTIGAGERNITRNHIPLDPASMARLPLTLTKTSGVASVSVGGVVPYEITVTNTDSLPYSGLDLIDTMPTGFALVPDTLTVDGTSIIEDRLPRGFAVRNLTINPGQTRVLQFAAAVGAGARLGTAVNQAVVRVPLDEREITDRAEAAVRVLATAEFDCAEVIGKVFDDKNQNGLQDHGELGLSGARLATAKGLLITTDEHGRYHIACAAVPNASIGSNFILKLDPRSLPTGYRMVSENPRVIRLTRGKMSKANFAASLPRQVTLDLENAAFMPGRIELSPAMMGQLPTLMAALKMGETTLRLNYHAQGDGDLGQARLNALATYLAARWKREGCCFELSIERRVIDAGQPYGQFSPAQYPQAQPPYVPSAGQTYPQAPQFRPPPTTPPSSQPAQTNGVWTMGSTSPQAVPSGWANR